MIDYVKKQQLDIDDDLYQEWKDHPVTRQLLEDLKSDVMDHLVFEIGTHDDLEVIAMKSIKAQHLREFTEELENWSPVGLNN